jgi:hypothetical protein
MRVSQITIRAGLLGLIGLFILNGSAAQENRDSANHATGLIPLDAAQIGKIVSSWPRITRVGINHLGFDRVNEVRSKKGKTPLDSLLVKPVGGEVESAPAVLGTAAQPAAANENLAGDLPVSVDNSLLRFFPPIRSQGSLGSCASFATTYTQLSYMTAFQRNLDIRDPADNTNKYSPKWTYNMVNGGADNGSYFSDVCDLLEKHGAATWAEFPYDADFRAWCLSAAAWRGALGVRTKVTQYMYDVSRDAGLEQLKELLTDGYVVVFGTYIRSWVFKTISDDPSTSADDTVVGRGVAYWLSGTEGSHAMTIVGYNDAIWTDINSDGYVDPGEKGAFRIANSWGTDWGEAGFTWLSYDALRSYSKVPGGPSVGRNEAFQGDMAFVLTARDNYSPLMIAEFALSHAKRNQLLIGLGRSDTTTEAPTSWWVTSALHYQGGAYAFDGSTTAVSGTFVLDYSDILVAGAGTLRYYLTLYDNTAGDPATLSAFKIIDLTTDPPTEVASPFAPQTADNQQINPYAEYAYTGPDHDDPPQLSNLWVDPSWGRPGDTFTFDVSYSDPERDVPSVKNVIIDGAPQSMALVSGQPANGTYRFAGTLPAGAHRVYCYFEDGRGGSARAPLAGAVSLPLVYSHLVDILAPGFAMAGGPSFIMTVNGSDLPAGSVVTWDGSDRPTTFVSSSRVDAEIAAGDLVPGKLVTIAIRDPSGGYGNSVTFPVNNPRPALTSLSPIGATGGGGGLDLILHGSWFVSNSLAHWNGVSKPTTYVSATELRASLSSSDLGAGGQYEVTVSNPAPEGGSSQDISFPVSDFTINKTDSTLNGLAGQTFKTSVSVHPRNGPFDSAVAFSCSGLPRGCTASFSPATLIPGANGGSTVLTIVTTARSSSAAAAVVGPGSLIPPATGMILVLALFGALAAPTLLRRTTPSRPALRRLATALLIVLVVWLAACGAGGGGGSHNQGTPAGTYQLLLQGYSGSLTSMIYLTLTIQ